MMTMVYKFGDNHFHLEWIIPFKIMQ